MKKLALLLLLLVIGLLQYRLWFGDGSLREISRLKARIDTLEQEGEKRRQRNAALEAEVKDLRSGGEAVEERARQGLGLIKDGEVFIQVIEETPANSRRNRPPRRDPEPTSAPRGR